jgi:MFS family permease
VASAPATSLRVTVSAYFGLSDEANVPRSGRRRSASWQVLGRNRDFRRYFIGSASSDLGTWFQNTAQILLAYKLSHSAALSALTIGLVTCAQYSSPLFLSAWAGVMTRRFGGQRTLLCTQLVAAVCAAVMAGFVFAGPIDMWGLTAGAVVSGLVFTFTLPARNVMVRRLVARADQEPAFSMDSVSYNLGRAVAPPLSVLLVATMGFGWSFALNAVSFAVFAVCIALAGPGQAADAPAAAGSAAGRAGGGGTAEGSRILDGFRLAFTDWEIAVPLLMVAAVTVADDPVTVLGPALARHLHASADWSGVFIAALGAGTVLGSFRPSRHDPSLRKAATALAILAGCMILFVQSSWVLVSAVAALGAGASCLVANATTKTLLSRRAGPAREASVMAVWAIAWAGSKPLASLSDGLLANWLGLKWDGVLLALPALIPFLVLITLLLAVYATRASDRWITRMRDGLTDHEWFRRAQYHLVPAPITSPLPTSALAPASVFPPAIRRPVADLGPAAIQAHTSRESSLVYPGRVAPPSYLLSESLDLWGRR